MSSNSVCTESRIMVVVVATAERDKCLTTDLGGKLRSVHTLVKLGQNAILWINIVGRILGDVPSQIQSGDIGRMGDAVQERRRRCLETHKEDVVL